MPPRRRSPSIGPSPFATAGAAWLADARPPAGSAVGAFLAAAANHRGIAPALLAPEWGLPGRPEAACVPGALLALAEAGPGGLAHAVGELHELVRRPSDRAAKGAVYTPWPVASRLVSTGVALARPGVGLDGGTICDPAAGGGVFLVAAARHLMAAGVGARDVLSRLWGADVDPVAVAVSRAALLLWLGEHGDVTAADRDLVVERLVCGDPLVDGAGAWAQRPPSGHALVVGNPPFLGQLKRRTTRSRADAARLAARFGELARPYTDAASLFLLASLELCRPGGVAQLIVPHSTLVSRDSRGVRDELLEVGELAGIWLGGSDIFDADVNVVAVAVRRHAADGVGDGGRVTAPAHVSVPRWEGRDVTAAPACVVDAAQLAGGPTWGVVVADLHGIPPFPPELLCGPRAIVGDLATATAGFRDEYYALAPFVVEAADPGARAAPADPKLVTVGLVDFAHLRWGSEPTRFHKQPWREPVVDLARIDAESRLGRWGRERLVPKVVIATQTPVIEGVVDRDGSLWPSTPAIAVSLLEPGAASEDALWRLAAALVSPHASVWAATVFPGAGLVPGSLKLAAWQVLQIPLPLDGARWTEGAALLARAHGAADAGDPDVWRDACEAFGEVMAGAYGDDDADLVRSWWWARLPHWRAGSL